MRIVELSPLPPPSGRQRGLGVGLVNVLSTEGWVWVWLMCWAQCRSLLRGHPWAAWPWGCRAVPRAAAVPSLLPRCPEEEDFSITMGALTGLLQDFFPSKQEAEGTPKAIPIPLSRWRPSSCFPWVTRVTWECFSLMPLCSCYDSDEQQPGPWDVALGAAGGLLPFCCPFLLLPSLRIRK